jgi:serine/threonine protein kinase
MMYQLLRGLDFIHSNGYAHRDIKMDNIMITRSGQIKYIDFGLACLRECPFGVACLNLCTTDQVGTIPYTPPEYYSAEYEPAYENEQSHDIWSLGIVFFILTNAGLFPFETDDSIEITQTNIQNGVFDSCDYEFDFKDGSINLFVDNIIQTNWEDRPTIETLLADFIDHIATKIEVAQ